MKFQDPRIHGSKVTGGIKSMTHELTNAYTEQSIAIFPTNVFKVGDIKGVMISCSQN